MPNIDELTIQFKSRGIATIVKNINALATAVDSLSSKSNGLNVSQLSALAGALGELKKNAPNGTQVKNLTNLATAIQNLNTAAGSGNITTFATDISTVSTALNGIKGTPSKDLDKVTDSLKRTGEEAKKTAGDIGKVEKNTQNIKFNTPQMPKVDVSAFTSQFEQVNRHLTKASDMATKFGRALRDSKTLVPTNKMKSLQDEAEKVRKKYEELRSAMIKTAQSADFDPSSKAWESQSAKLDALRNQYDELIMKQKELALAGNGFQLNPAITGTLNAFAQGFSKVTNLIKNGFISALRTANSTLSSLVKNMVRLVTASKSIKNAGNGVKDLARKLSNELLRVSKMLKLMVTRMALRKVIEEVGNGFKSLALHCETFNQNMSNVINGAKKLGYSFAGMIEPLINALAPALIYLINLITNLLNALNQLFTALGGGTVWHRAKDFTGSWADSIEKANKSAKELKKTVLGFDELNQLQDTKKSGGDTSGNIVDMFEDVQIDPKWKKYADWLKEMWKLGDFTDLGAFLGKKLRDLLESIPWDEIQDTAGKLGKSLATLINGFVEIERLGYDIGYTIAQALNTVFRFVNDFVHALHWDSIGKFIADTFNGFFENIHWGVIKDTVITGLAGIADAINAFIHEFHWDNISNTIVNGLNIIIHGINTFFRRVQWGELGKNLGEQLQKTIEGIHWRELGETLGRILQSAVDFLSNFIHQLKLDEIRAKAKEMVEGFFNTVNSEELGRTLGEILQFAIDFLVGFWDDNGEQIKQEFHDFFTGLWDTLDDNLPELLGIAFDIGWQIVKEIGRGLLENKSVIGIALLGGLVSASKYAIGAIVGKKLISSIVTKAMLDAGIAGGTSLATGAAGAVTAEAGTSGILGSAVAAGGMSIGASLAACVVTAFASYKIGNKIIGPWMFPDQKEVYENFRWFEGEDSFFNTIFGTDTQTLKDAWHMMWSDMWSETRWGKKNLEELTPELQNLKTALEENGMKIGDNVNALNQINDGLKLFQENGGNTTETLQALGDKYGDVDKKTQDFFNSLGLCEDKYADVVTKVNDYNSKLDESDKQESNLIKTYKNHTEVLEDIKKGHENVVGQFKTHWDIVNQNKKATDEYNDSNKDLKGTLNDTTSVLDDVKVALGTAKGAEQDVVEYTPEFSKALEEARTEMTKTSDEAEVTGENIINGIKEPLSKVNFDTETKIVFDVLFAALAHVFGISSPAKNMMPIGENIILGVDEGMEGEFGTFDKVFSDFYDNYVKKWFDKDMWSFDGVGEGLKNTFESAKTAIGKVWNGIADNLNGEHEIGSSKIKINLPKFKYANGGFPEDGFFFANHNELVGGFSNGKTAVANNAQIVSGIERGVYSAVSAAMATQGSGTSYISNEIVVDGDVIARTITKAQEKQNRRYSPQTV